MCFERSKGIQKCRWNKKPKCIANKYVETGDGLVFRSGADQFLEKSSKRCENQNWDYQDQIVCSNGFFDGSLCRIEGIERLLPTAYATVPIF